MRLQLVAQGLMQCRGERIACSRAEFARNQGCLGEFGGTHGRRRRAHLWPGGTMHHKFIVCHHAAA